MTIRYNKQQTFDPLYANIVGANPNSTLRTLDTPAPTNANSYFVSPAGDDYAANAGDSDSPCASLNMAFYMEETTPRGAITIIRHTLPADEAITFEAPEILLPGGNLQVELGEIATIQKENLLLRHADYPSALFRTVALASNGTVWVALPFSGPIKTSVNGFDWVDSSSGSYVWADLTYGNGVFVASRAGTNTLFISTDGNTWSTPTGSCPSGAYTTLAFDNGIFIAHETNAYALYTSTDGNEWTEISDNPLPITDLQYFHGVWIASIQATAGVSTKPSGLYYSLDLQNWHASDVPPINVSSLTKTESLAICASREGCIYYSEDGIHWFLALQTQADFRDILYAEGLGFAIDYTTHKLFYSYNGRTWFDSGLLADEPYCLGFSNGRFLLGENGSSGTQGVRLIMTDVLTMRSNTNVNGIYLQGNYKAFTGIGAYGNSNGTVKWCTFDSIINAGIQGMDQPTIENSIFKNSTQSGVQNCENPVISYSIFSAITETAIMCYGSSTSLNHLTLHNCKQGIYLHSIPSTSIQIKNSIFSRCGMAVSNHGDPFILDHCIINGTLYHCTPGENSLVSIKPLFHNPAQEDFKLKHTEEGYTIASAGIGASDTSTDLGAWQVTFTQTDLSFTTVFIPGTNILVEQGKKAIHSETAFSLASHYKRYCSGWLETWILQLRDNAGSALALEWAAIRQYDKPMHFFPVDQGVFSAEQPGSFSWMHPAYVDGLVRLTISDATDQESISTFCQNQRMEGWFCLVESIAGASTINQHYPYKIIQAQPGTLLLENIGNAYPDHGFSSAPGGAYTYHLVKALFLGRVQYQGLNTHNEMVWECAGLSQSFVLNQWKAFWFHTDYSDTLGERSYFRILRNSETNIYAEDPLGNASSLTQGAYYSMVIDMAMVKAEPTDFQPTVPNNQGEHGKHGNDYYSTQITREKNAHWPTQGYLSHNFSQAQLTLLESLDMEPSGL